MCEAFLPTSDIQFIEKIFNSFIDCNMILIIDSLFSIRTVFGLSLDTFISFIFNHTQKAQTLQKCETRDKSQKSQQETHARTKNNWMAKNNPRRYFYPQSTTTSIAQNARRVQAKNILETKLCTSWNAYIQQTKNLRHRIEYGKRWAYRKYTAK